MISLTPNVLHVITLVLHVRIILPAIPVTLQSRDKPNQQQIYAGVWMAIMMMDKIRTVCPAKIHAWSVLMILLALTVMLLFSDRLTELLITMVVLRCIVLVSIDTIVLLKTQHVSHVTTLVKSVLDLMLLIVYFVIPLLIEH